ncbi:FHA domain-containing protein [Oscillatoria sp. FACHB-1407]|uniref:FHA domain-containing protein n=1 Tax=Oscillatoria sp. FACHB-1407 TaxID=2692847 RepID=UPI001684BA45|nr:FHA domain-containing protein [Oscillatoria sp. FACHB-1407]MBD2463221.1 FHA domain-containing protein [Oscillatoria sp. FACHB-1407]
MFNFTTSSVSGHNPLSFLERNPTLTDALLADCNYNRDEVIAVAQRILDCPQRCQLTASYIQIVVTAQTTFLVTNLNSDQKNCLVESNSTWLIGRDATCAITIPDSSVSRCHAVVGYHPIDGVYIADVGSSNGTFVNRRRLIHRERRTLQDGDLLQLGELKIEFFLTTRKLRKPVTYEPTYS